MKTNGWQTRWGAARRATDKALLAALEAQIAKEEAEAAQRASQAQETASREAIARAFGRPA